MKFKNAIKVSAFLLAFFFSFTLISFLTASPVQAATCGALDTKNRVGGGGYGDFSFSPDVNCRCAINECRLSRGFDNLYTCVTGGTSANESNTVQEGSQYDIYSDNILLNRFLSGAKTEGKPINYYLDSFNQDVQRQIIPEGSYCRVSPSDENGVAYWYYPGYFDIIQGRKPQEPGDVATGGRCTDVVFVNKDLFNNTVEGTQTFFGCLPNSINGLVAFVIRLVTGLAIVIALLIILINFIQIIANSTNPDAIAEHQKRMNSAIFTLVGILLSITILSILGIQILYLGTEGVGGSIFRLFVGG